MGRCICGYMYPAKSVEEARTKNSLLELLELLEHSWTRDSPSLRLTSKLDIDTDLEVNINYSST